MSYRKSKARLKLLCINTLILILCATSDDELVRTLSFVLMFPLAFSISDYLNSRFK
jgi:hypothetical protein